MGEQTLFRLLGGAAVLGGVLRIAAAFVPWEQNVAWLEAFYFVIDVALLFGLMGIYFADHARLGVAGFAAFALAETGIASIVGPDGMAFGLDVYQLGVFAISIGLAVLGIVMLMVRAGSVIAASCWILSLVVGLAATFANQPEAGFVAGGILFGLGFVAAGAALIRPATN
jgi:hypothetical protein